MNSLKINKEVQKCLNDWITYLDKNLNYSQNTINAYITDIYYFLQFIFNHHGESISLELLDKLEVHDFRSWLAFRKRNNIASISNNRTISSIKNFYKFLKEQMIIKRGGLPPTRNQWVGKPIGNRLGDHTYK